MKFKALGLIIVGFGLFAAVPTALAHHSFMPEFDMRNPIALQGVVTKVDWANPHITVFINVTDRSGKVTNWAVEGAPPSVLAKRGWTRDSMNPNDKITVEAYAARNKSAVAAMSTVTLTDGRRIFGGSDGVRP